MKVWIDAPLRIGEATVAAVSEQSVAVRGSDRGFAFLGAKRPLAILIRVAGETLAFEVDGAPLPLEQFDQRHPKLRAEFERRVGA